MSAPDPSREAILTSIRRSLWPGRSGEQRARTASSSESVRPQTHEAATRAELCDRFRTVLERAGGRTHHAADEDEAARTIAAIALEVGAREIALSDSPLVQRLTRPLQSRCKTFDAWRDRGRLFGCTLGITGAQWGIAETGTLVLDAEAERSRLASLVPPVHVAVLPARDLVADFDRALALAGRGGRPPSTLTFVTGPSRTADIELVLVVGVHGPRELHVVLLD